MKYILLLFLNCLFLTAKAQQFSGFHIGIEYGTSQMTGEIDERWEFRQTIDSYANYEGYDGSESAIGEGAIHYAGLKTTYSIWNDRLTFASGLRYVNIHERIFPGGSSPHLYLYQPSNEGIEFFRLYGIEESLGYGTIPFEVDLLLLGYMSNWQVYVKGGIQVGMKLHEKNELDFVSQEMREYENSILSNMNVAQNNFFSNANGSIGLRLILRNGTRLAIEGTSSSIFLTNNNLSLLTSQSLPGVHFMLTVPIHHFSAHR